MAGFTLAEKLAFKPGVLVSEVQTSAIEFALYVITHFLPHYSN